MSNSGKVQSGRIPVAVSLRDVSPKTIAMVALLGVMGILWGRVLLKDGPEKAAAGQVESSLAQQGIQSEQPVSLEIESIELPQISGRNDCLTNNFFVANDWNALRLNGNVNNEINTSDDSIERALKLKLEQISKRLTLEAVIKDGGGTPHQAFIDGKILSVGNTLTVQEGPDQYVLTLKNISENEVTFSWNKVSVVLKIPETYEL